MYENQNENEKEYHDTNDKRSSNIDPEEMIDFWNEDHTNEGIEDYDITETCYQDYEVDELTLKKT